MQAQNNMICKEAFHKIRKDPECITIITVDSVNGAIQSILYGYHEANNLRDVVGKVTHLSVKGKDLMQDSWGDLKSHIEETLKRKALKTAA